MFLVILLFLGAQAARADSPRERLSQSYSNLEDRLGVLEIQVGVICKSEFQNKDEFRAAASLNLNARAEKLAREARLKIEFIQDYLEDPSAVAAELHEQDLQIEELEVSAKRSDAVGEMQALQFGKIRGSEADVEKARSRIRDMSRNIAKIKARQRQVRTNPDSAPEGLKEKIRSDSYLALLDFKKWSDLGSKVEKLRSQTSSCHALAAGETLDQSMAEAYARAIAKRNFRNIYGVDLELGGFSSGVN